MLLTMKDTYVSMIFMSKVIRKMISLSALIAASLASTLAQPLQHILLSAPPKPAGPSNRGIVLSDSGPPRIRVATPPFAANAKEVHLKWVIAVPIGSCIQFTLSSFSVDYAIACFTGYMAVFNGPDPSSPLLMRMCGEPRKMPPPVRTTSNKLHIAFYSESPGVSKQFVRQGFVGFAQATSCPVTPRPTTTKSTTNGTQTMVNITTTTTKTTTVETFDYYLPPELGPLANPVAPSTVGNVTSINFGNATICGNPFFKPLEDHTGVGRIVGGNVAEANSWPWQGSIRYRDQHICGAVLVSRLFVITAAHCFSITSDPRFYIIKFGRNTRDQPEPKTEQRLEIEAVMIHPDYQRYSRYDSDIALVKLKEPGVTSNAFVSPICLPRKAPPLNSYCYVTGYGKTLNTGGEGFLKQAALPIIPNDECSKMDPRIRELLTSNMLCAGFPIGGVDSCQGDSGGPLVCKVGKFPHQWTLAGLVSFGFDCALPNLPGVYTRVGKFVDWIVKNVPDLPKQY